MAYRRPETSRLIELSKGLSWLLRHNAEKQGFRFMPGGFLFVDEVLRHKRFKDFTEEDVQRVVETNDKQRFAIEEDAGSKRLKIRANQGHSLQVQGLELTPIQSAAEVPVVVHGTTMDNWRHIRREGLHRMNRNHIHFAPGEPGEDGVISGMRQSSEVLIFIDAEKALADGIQFVRSANNVILSPGDKEGLITPQYFKSVLESRTRRELLAGPKDSKEPGAKGGATAQSEEKEKRHHPNPGLAGPKDSKEPGAKGGAAAQPEEKEKRHHPIPGLPYTAEELADEMERHKKKKKKKKKNKNKNKEAEAPKEDEGE